MSKLACLLLVVASGCQVLTAVEPVDIVARVTTTDIRGEPPRPEVELQLLAVPDGVGLTSGERLTLPVGIKQWEAFWHRSVGKAYAIELLRGGEHGWRIGEIGERIGEDELAALGGGGSAAEPDASDAAAAEPAVQASEPAESADAPAVPTDPQQAPGAVDARIRAQLRAQVAMVAQRLAELETAGQAGAEVNPEARALLEQELASLGDQLAAFTPQVDAFDRALAADLARIAPEELSPEQQAAVRDLIRLTELRAAGAGSKVATLQRLRAELAGEAGDGLRDEAALAEAIDALLSADAAADAAAAAAQVELWVLDPGPTALVAYSGPLARGVVQLASGARLQVLAADGRYAVVAPLDRADELSAGARVLATAASDAER